MRSLATGCGATRHALAVRGDDLYETPVEAVTALLAIEHLPPQLWEPACGPGAIARTLRAAGHAVLATDLVDYDSPDQDHAGVDFLMTWPGQPGPAGWGAQAIVTNPPFKLAQAFVAQALKFTPVVAMLLRLAFLEGQQRRGWFTASPLARIHIASRRLPMMHRAGWTGPRTGNSGMAFAWFVWDRSHTGAPELRWFDWKDQGAGAGNQEPGGRAA